MDCRKVLDYVVVRADICTQPIIESNSKEDLLKKLHNRLHNVEQDLNYLFELVSKAKELEKLTVIELKGEQQFEYRKTFKNILRVLVNSRLTIKYSDLLEYDRQTSFDMLKDKLDEHRGFLEAKIAALKIEIENINDEINLGHTKLVLDHISKQTYFEKEVMGYVNNGYELLGSVSNSSNYICQALVKYAP